MQLYRYPNTFSHENFETNCLLDQLIVMRGSDPCHEKNSMEIGLKLLPFHTSVGTLYSGGCKSGICICGLQDMMKLGMTVGGGKFDYIKFKIKMFILQQQSSNH